MIARIYLTDFHGKDGCIMAALEDDASIIRDYEDHLMGRGQSVKTYKSNVRGGDLVIDFRKVAAIEFTKL